jgi:hypothetical protein
MLPLLLVDVHFLDERLIRSLHPIKTNRVSPWMSIEDHAAGATVKEPNQNDASHRHGRTVHPAGMRRKKTLSASIYRKRTHPTRGTNLQKLTHGRKN